MSLTDELQAHVRDRGLDLIGCTSTQPFGVGEAWLEADPRNILSEAQAVVIAACYLYGIDTVELSLPGRPRGRFGPWTKDIYENSVSSRCWWFTPYDAGWDESHKYGQDMRSDDELAQIVAMEQTLGGVPHWAQRIVERCINFLPPCGHYLFPRPYMEVVRAIGAQTSPVLVHGCFTVEQERKERMMDYALCLDAWLAGADSEAPARELMARARSSVNWHTVCAELWEVLGEHTETKELLVERTLHQTRWWIKSWAGDDDWGAPLCQDEYLGNFCESGAYAEKYGNPGLRAPSFDQNASPRVQKLETRLAEICPDWQWFRNLIVDGSWPCAPKAFRFLERLLWSIGKERPAVSLPSFPLEHGDDVPGFLQCEETYPNPEEAGQWWRSFLAALRAWWRGQPEKGDVADQVNERLGAAMPVKRWLVRLLVRKCELYEWHEEGLGRLLRPRPGSKRGAGPVE